MMYSGLWICMMNEYADFLQYLDVEKRDIMAFY